MEKLFALLLLTGFSIASASVLGDKAAQMAPNTWAEVITLNNGVHAATGASNNHYGYATDIVWDPVRRQLMFVGGDHNDDAEFVTYSDASNQWNLMPRPSWLGFTQYHAYDHQTIDPKREVYYTYAFGKSSTVHKYDVKSGAWSLTPPAPVTFASASAALAVAFFPERDALIVVDGFYDYGDIWELSEASQKWTKLGTITMGVAGLAEYNPVHKVVLFGGGLSGYSAPGVTGNLYKLDSQGKITPLKDLPSGVSLARRSGHLTVDPVSGDYYVTTSGHQFYKYDVISDQWTLLPSANIPLWSVVDGLDGEVNGPVGTYGVTAFLGCKYSGCRLFLYKGRGGVAAETQAVRGSNPLGIRVHPNPFRSSAVVDVRGVAGGAVQAGLYDMCGRLIEKLSPSDAEKGQWIWRPGAYPAGIYLFKAQAAGKFHSVKLYYQK